MKAIKLFVIFTFVLFLAFYVEKIREFKNYLKINILKERINELLICNNAIKSEIEIIIGNSYVNYDRLTERIKTFKKSFEKVQLHALFNEIGAKKELQHIEKNFFKELDLIESIIQYSAIIKSSYLYLPTLEKDLVLSDPRNYEKVKAINEILDILSYQIISYERSVDQRFFHLLKKIKKTQRSNQTFQRLLENFSIHALLIYQAIQQINPVIERFYLLNGDIAKEIESLQQVVENYEEELGQRKLLIESFFVVLLFIFTLLIFVLIKKEQKVEEELKKAAEFDFLTNLPNRYKLFQEMKKRKRLQKRYSAILFDIDNFAYTNEHFGLEVGDTILRQFGNVLKFCSLSHAYHISSDEFIVLLDTLDTKELELFFKRVNELSKIEINYPLSFSAGAYLIDANCDLKKFIFYLQASLFSAKRKGGEVIVIYDEKDPFIKEYNEILRKGFESKRDIEKALKNDLFVLYYQPIYNIKAQKIEKYEALIRMKEGDKVIYPAQFIEYAEKFNLIGKITRVVIDKGFALSAKKRVKLSLNLSSLDIVDKTLFDYIYRKYEEYGIEPSFITFEVTETSVMQDIDIALSFLKRLKEVGFEIAIDDFGSGYSSLQYIRDIPADFIKIDGVFIKDIDVNEQNREFVADINHIIKKAAKRSIAEFVENEQILNYLANIGVDYAQGYYIGKPQPLE